ncbi:hypothetical protein JQ506_15525 [Shinella sp. PSBB067]|uniref:hypothetical protein n=1 Tax=Shinella sp. PSBB067 TaxID=2715959 RepID=UPI00193BD660|nr:hypothetical protein [Shinella sp. PSBB067]QRI62278.1 hypothetical protein JQ506_15525 [Shinella sp. PSBB067]
MALGLPRMRGSMKAGSMVNDAQPTKCGEGPIAGSGRLLGRLHAGRSLSGPDNPKNRIDALMKTENRWLNSKQYAILLK